MKAQIIPTVEPSMTVEINGARTIVRIRTAQATVYYRLAKGIVEPLRAPPRDAFTPIASIDSGPVPYLLFLVELEGSEIGIPTGELLATKPGYVLRRNGKDLVFRFLTTVAPERIPPLFVASACSLEHVRFVPRRLTAVAMLDVLGYSRIIEHSPLEDVLLKQREGVSTLLRALPLFCDTRVTQHEDHITWEASEFSCSSVAVLDSIILYVARPSLTPLYDISRAAAYLMRTALTWGWLLRGGIDFGEFYASGEDGIYLGKALVAAHELELAQNWSGCLVSRRLAAEFPDDLDRLRREAIIVEYDVPVKGGIGRDSQRDLAKSAYVLNWLQPAMLQPVDVVGELRRLMAAAPSDGKAKMRETIAFCEWAKASGCFATGQAKVSLVGRDEST